MVIYKLTNIINNKIYIGLTTETPEERHRKRLVQIKRGETSYLHNAILKHGDENFKMEILETCNSIEELKEREKFYIKELNTRNRKIGYNLSEGGDGTPGVLKSEHTRNLIRQKALGRKASEETKDKMKSSARSRIWTSEMINAVKTNGRKSRKKIEQYDLNGVYIKTWDSLREASQNYNISHANISNVINGRNKTAAGFLWKLKG